MALWFDLSPMRPDQFAATVARPWLHAVQLRVAYDAGVKDAREEADAQRSLDAVGDED